MIIKIIFIIFFCSSTVFCFWRLLRPIQKWKFSTLFFVKFVSRYCLFCTISKREFELLIVFTPTTHTPITFVFPRNYFETTCWKTCMFFICFDFQTSAPESVPLTLKPLKVQDMRVETIFGRGLNQPSIENRVSSSNIKCFHVFGTLLGGNSIFPTRLWSIGWMVPGKSRAKSTLFLTVVWWINLCGGSWVVLSGQELMKMTGVVKQSRGHTC